MIPVTRFRDSNRKYFKFFGIDDFQCDTITEAIKKIEETGKDMNGKCRNFFLTHFYYRNQMDAFKKIVEKVEKEEVK